ncbi:MAG TPA: UDP-N-acetylmuramoyl-L-alanine--D-glutamate ligase [Candidatus Saccharimonadales bacterium]|nr:UDP-N-acetylmuramoyl-L-alanine--D-glutamate ligase [Candidatus Saccharimonadales bacterium]
MKIAIAGYGVEGKSSYEYFSKRGDDITILDGRTEIEDLPEGVRAVLGAAAFSQLEDYDMVVRSPSLAPRKLAGAKKIWSATNEFFARCPAPIIGVTGTKGKGTTSSLTAAILREAGRTVHLVGNIGTPALDELAKIQPSDIVVYEMSSFQLWDIEKSPHVAVILMIEPDHLNVHADFDDYVLAKGNIAAHQQAGDVVIYHPTNDQSARAANLSGGKKMRYMTPEAAHIKDGMIMMNETEICPTEKVGLKGGYNLENVCAAVSAAWQFTQNVASFARAIEGFKGLEHRLEYVATKQGVEFYNDSFSSAPTATIAAITAFSEPIVLIVGGYDKGVDLTPLAENIVSTPNIEKVVVIGQTRGQIADTFSRLGFTKFDSTSEADMEKIVALALGYAPKGGVVLLSPGCASFDMFKNFYERGRLFKRAVGELHE